MEKGSSDMSRRERRPRRSVRRQAAVRYIFRKFAHRGQIFCRNAGDGVPYEYLLPLHKKGRPFRGGRDMYAAYLASALSYFLILDLKSTSMAAAEAMPTTTAIG